MLQGAVITATRSELKAGGLWFECVRIFFLFESKIKTLRENKV